MSSSFRRATAYSVLIHAAGCVAAVWADDRPSNIADAFKPRVVLAFSGEDGEKSKPPRVRIDDKELEWTDSRRGLQRTPEWIAVPDLAFLTGSRDVQYFIVQLLEPGAHKIGILLPSEKARQHEFELGPAETFHVRVSYRYRRTPIRMVAPDQYRTLYFPNWRAVEAWARSRNARPVLANGPIPPNAIVLGYTHIEKVMDAKYKGGERTNHKEWSIEGDQRFYWQPRIRVMSTELARTCTESRKAFFDQLMILLDYPDDRIRGQRDESHYRMGDHINKLFGIDGKAGHYVPPGVLFPGAEFVHEIGDTYTFLAAYEAELKEQSERSPKRNREGSKQRETALRGLRKIRDTLESQFSNLDQYVLDSTSAMGRGDEGAGGWVNSMPDEQTRIAARRLSEAVDKVKIDLMRLNRELDGEAYIRGPNISFGRFR